MHLELPELQPLQGLRGERDVAAIGRNVRHDRAADEVVGKAIDFAILQPHAIQVAAAVALRAEDQALAVGRPDRIEIVGGRVGDARDVRAVRVHHIQVELVPALPRRFERDARAVRRPARMLIVMILS